jgi:hypothetical protein
MNLIKALWYGDVTLAKAAWIYGAFGSIILAFPLNLINATGVTYGHSGAFYFFILAHSVIVLTYSGFISVAIWRSAAKYTGLWLWPLLVKLSIVLILLAVFAAFLWGVTL